MKTPLTSFEEILWPAIPSQSASTRLAIQYQLEQSQWWSPEKLLNHQLEQLSIVLTHAYKTVPFYQEFYKSQSFKPKRILTEQLLSEIPIVSRKDVQKAGDKIVSTNIPKHHGNLHDISTSGSTGATIKIKNTYVGQFFFNAFTLRDHLLHKRELHKKYSAIRLTASDDALPPVGKHVDVWDASFLDIYKSGPASLLSIKSSIGEQWTWLKKENPEYFLTYPSNIDALIEKSEQEGNPLTNLRQIISFGETVTDEVRQGVKRSFGVPLIDMYSCQEVGYMAFQCPEHEHYHVQSENIILEVLNDNNEPCKAGEIGRVVITSLHNFASPLIRYDIGDYAEVGEPCPCGRGLPVLKRIVGRVRNLITYPDGTKAWPLVGSDSYDDIIHVKQFQFIQTTVNDIEVKLVIEGVLSKEDEVRLKDRMIQSLRHPFNIIFTFHDKIERSEGGKFEDFISHVK